MPHLNIPDRSPLVRIEVVDHLPDGRLVARIESPHQTVFIVNGENLPDGFKPYLAEFEVLMQEAVESLMWQRSPLPPPEAEDETPDEGAE
ncbi:hypothetical protein ACFC1T_27270 [Kitasatospora sp. NPDC056076]|uniref:hypothetical protein n=1 Tax=Kitasatospora sp. NPDC056076 TaxID=3345703 RepID=UPI0035DAC763